MRTLFRMAIETQDTFWIFMLLTVVIGGGAAWMAGRAIASAWRPWWHVAALTLLIGAAVRFLHFALFEEPLLSLPGYLVDAAVCVAFGLIGFRVMRVRQMVTSYDWINKRAGPFRWQKRIGNPSESG